MSHTTLVWFLIIGILGACGTAPAGGSVSRPILEFLAWLGLAIFALLALLGILVA